MTIHEHRAWRSARAQGSWLCAWLALACDSTPDTSSQSDEDAGGGDSVEVSWHARLRASDQQHISLNSVWGAAADDVWAVGTRGTVVHFDGERWQQLDPITESNLTSVHGYRSDDVWAVGEDIALHWDGASWSVALQDVSETLLGVWQSDADDVWMVGIALDINCGLIRHWDGSKWSWAELNGVSTLWEVWNSPDNTLWVGGTAAGGAGFLGQAQEMQLTRTKYPGGSLRGIWGSSSDDVWVAPYAGSMQHWDGSQWSEHDVGTETLRLLSISGSAEQDVWAVGLGGRIVHWDGEMWSQVESSTEATLWSVWTFSPENAWAVGGEILHWDGKTWQPATNLEQ